jgi:hypothetical protein
LDGGQMVFWLFTPTQREPNATQGRFKGSEG